MEDEELDSAYDAAISGDNHDEDEDDTPESGAAKPAGNRDQHQDADADDDDDQDAEDSEDDDDTDASEDEDLSDKNGNEPTLDEGIYDALKSKPELSKSLKEYEARFKETITREQNMSLVLFDAPVENLRGAFEVMAKARKMSPEELASQLVGKSFAEESQDSEQSKQLDPKDPMPEEPDFEKWDEEGWDSKGEMRNDYQLRLLRWEMREKDRRDAVKQREAEDRQKAETQRQQEAQKLQTRAEQVAQRLRSTTGWKLSPAKVAEAMQKFPNLDPLHAAKAAFPDDYADHKSKVASSKGQKRAPTLNRGASRNPERPIAKDEDWDDMYERVASGTGE